MSPWTSVSVDRGATGVRTLRELVDSWDFHVRRLEREARTHYPSGSRDLRDVWGVYDLIAANGLRDTLERLVLAPAGRTTRADPAPPPGAPSGRGSESRPPREEHLTDPARLERAAPLATAVGRARTG